MECDIQSDPGADLTGHDYSIRAVVADAAGNSGQAEHDFTSTVCFMPGTMIRTPDGEVAVETLKRGDLVLTADNRAEPVAWIGRQTVSRLFSDPARGLADPYPGRRARRECSVARPADLA